jgi:hypothetical protein
VVIDVRYQARPRVEHGIRGRVGPLEEARWEHLAVHTPQSVTKEMRTLRLLVGCIAALVVACGHAAPPASRPANAASSSPCGTLAPSATHSTHVIWIWMENHSYRDIIGSRRAPYINGLAGECGLATNYHNVAHPSLPNYVAATSGLPYDSLSTFTSDCNPSRSCSTSAASIFSQLTSWKAYEESMPSNCYGRNSGEYAVRHNPPRYFTTLAGCASDDVPYTALASDLAAGTLPAFSFVTPNLIDDMHDGTIQQGDTWLSQHVPNILNSSVYKSGQVALFITWDEGEGGSANACATNTTDAGCHVATLVVSARTTPGTQSATLFNHYSLLGSTESLLGVSNLATRDPAGTADMLTPFGL